ncbi:hypothetical protein F4780DRAFT_425645 [Xylariomycetidae sp. FL0641]|nr:hypothetical protein F4780DRAFT_425645 [Xylariomycetidae sp. FL0641]
MSCGMVRYSGLSGYLSTDRVTLSTRSAETSAHPPSALVIDGECEVSRTCPPKVQSHQSRLRSGAALDQQAIGPCVHPPIATSLALPLRSSELRACASPRLAHHQSTTPESRPPPRPPPSVALLRRLVLPAIFASAERSEACYTNTARVRVLARQAKIRRPRSERVSETWPPAQFHTQTHTHTRAQRERERESFVSALHQHHK